MIIALCTVEPISNESLCSINNSQQAYSPGAIGYVISYYELGQYYLQLVREVCYQDEREQDFQNV
jgi:hypothetical protein